VFDLLVREIFHRSTYLRCFIEKARDRVNWQPFGNPRRSCPVTGCAFNQPLRTCMKATSIKWSLARIHASVRELACGDGRRVDRSAYYVDQFEILHRGALGRLGYSHGT
jgi:hypothetical protein